MRAVNLLPDDRRVAKGGSSTGGSRVLLAAVVAVSVLIVGGLALLVWSSSSSVSSKQKQLATLRTQIAAMPVSPGIGTSAAATINAEKLPAVTGLVGARLPFDQLLQALSKVTPEDVWLQSLTANTPGAAATVASQQAAAAVAETAGTAAPTTTDASTATPVATIPTLTPGTFTITGFTYSQPSVARLMRRLSIVPWLSQVGLVTTSKSQIGDHTIVQFTVNASVLATPAVAS